jgi:hypothetical protein
MFRDRLSGALKRSKKSEKDKEEALQVLYKMEREERLSSKEFIKLYDDLWKEGPLVKYQSPDAWNKRLPEISDSS